jgi:hypothetical protein
LATVVLVRGYSRISGAMSKDSDNDSDGKRRAIAAAASRSCAGLA